MPQHAQGVAGFDGVTDPRRKGRERLGKTPEMIGQRARGIRETGRARFGEKLGDGHGFNVEFVTRADRSVVKLIHAFDRRKEKAPRLEG
jgi:hypothetical protein